MVCKTDRGTFTRSMCTLSHPRLGDGAERRYLLLVLIKEGRWLQEDEIRPDRLAPGTMRSLRLIATHHWKFTDPANPIFLNHSMEGADGHGDSTL